VDVHVDAWKFHVDVVGYCDDPEEAWGGICCYRWN
jgi:hypothetical protein